MKEKICFRCHKLIEEDSNYYVFAEFNKKKIVNTEHTHKICWDEFLAQLSSLSKAQNILQRVNLNPLIEMGLISPEEVIIK